MNVAGTDFGCLNIFLAITNLHKTIYTNSIRLHDPVVNKYLTLLQEAVYISPLPSFQQIMHSVMFCNILQKSCTCETI